MNFHFISEQLSSFNFSRSVAQEIYVQTLALVVQDVINAGILIILSVWH